MTPSRCNMHGKRTRYLAELLLDNDVKRSVKMPRQLSSTQSLLLDKYPFASHLVDFLCVGGTRCTDFEKRDQQIRLLPNLSETVGQESGLCKGSATSSENTVIKNSTSLIESADKLSPSDNYQDFFSFSGKNTIVASNQDGTTSSIDLEVAIISCIGDNNSENSGHVLLSAFGKDFEPALHVAIRKNASAAALSLIQCGAPVEAENAKGVTAVILASQKGNFMLVQELLKRGASPSTISVNGTTAVMQAAHFGHNSVLKMLLDIGGNNLMEVANYNRTTPLMRAAQEGHESVVNLLLEKGAVVNRRNHMQMTALMLASQRGHSKICKLLIEHGADLDLVTAQNTTSLLLACKRANIGVVRVLVTAGCELWVKDARGRTAREKAQRRNLKELIELLDSSVQIDLMQRQERKQRTYDIIRLWNLLHQERATVPIDYGNQYRYISVHHVKVEQNRCLESTQALLRTMKLPAPLVELIAAYLPLPHLWQKRCSMLMKRSMINANAAITCALDLIDEVLVEGGFLDACDYAKITPPNQFKSWREWKTYVSLHNQTPIFQNCYREITINANFTSKFDSKFPSAVEFRRQAKFLQILAYQSRLLTRILSAPPYNMQMALINQLITSSTIAGFVRRMGCCDFHLDSTIAIDLIMLASNLCSWYNRNLEWN